MKFSPLPWPKSVFLLKGEDVVRSRPSVVSDLWGRFVEIGLASLLINLFGLCTPIFSMLIYDKVIGNDIPETLWALTAGMVIAAGIDFVLRLIRAFYVEQIAFRADVDVDHTVMNRILSQSDGATFSAGELLSTYRDLIASREIISSSYMLAVADLPFLVLYLMLLAYLGGSVFLIVLAIGIVLVGFNLALKHPTAQYSNLAQRFDADRLAMLAEITTHADLIRASPLRQGISRRWSDLVRLSAFTRSKSRLWAAIGYSSIADGALLMWVAALTMGSMLVSANSLSVGGLTACSLLTSRAAGLIGSFALLWSRYDLFTQAKDHFEKILPPAAQDQTDYLPPRALRGELRVVDLSFRFPASGRFSLSNINFAVQPGEKIGILGRNGSGKSTLLRCMAGVLAPSAGQVIIDNANLRGFDPTWRATWLAYKPQDPLLLAGTLEHNLLDSQKGIDAEALATCLHVSGVQDAIARGEFSLETQILPGGANLSGGQRQAIALARSLASGPNLLLLDEPTAGVDQEMESQVAARLLDYVTGRKTLIVATHSLPLLKAMDRIIVIQDGAIIADGPRDQIIVG